MNRFFKYTLFTVLLLLQSGWCAVLQRSQVEQAGIDWLHRAAYFAEMERSDRQFTPLKNALIPISNSGGENPVAYVLPLAPTGFVVLAADDRLKPVVAYSAESDFSGADEPENILLQMVRNDMLLRARALRENRTPAELLRKYRRFWRALLEDVPISGKEAAELFGSGRIYGPFLNESTSGNFSPPLSPDSIYFFPTPTWGQGYVNGSLVFNLYTPFHWSAGCVATGMAQILTYYRWPPVGTGSHSYYEDDAGWLSANYGQTAYDWANTLDMYLNVLSTQAQKQAAGLLTYHCCVSVNMDFEATGSTASTSDAPYALHNYFRCSGHYMSASSAFFDQLRNNMQDARPAALAISSLSGGPGHSVVADGYSDANGYFHLNMGWNGVNNSWYDITGAFYATGYGDAIVDGGTKGIVPNPMIEDSLTWVNQNSFYLSWNVSFRQNAQKYELQQKTQSGSWNTLSSTIQDTSYLISGLSTGRYYYRVRAYRDNIWWDWSETKEVNLGANPTLTFRVNMSNRPLQPGENVVLLGNIPPLGGLQNSPVFSGPDLNGVYTADVTFENIYIADTLLYRYGVYDGSQLTLEDSNRVYVITGDEFQVLDAVYFNVYTAITASVSPSIPSRFLLHQNYPNPFNAATMVEFMLPRAGKISLLVYDLLGQEVARIFTEKYFPAGVYRARIDFNRVELPSGIYYLRLQSGKSTAVKKMLYVR